MKKKIMFIGFAALLVIMAVSLTSSSPKKIDKSDFIVMVNGVEGHKFAPIESEDGNVQIIDLVTEEIFTVKTNEDGTRQLVNSDGEEEDWWLYCSRCICNLCDSFFGDIYHLLGSGCVECPYCDGQLSIYDDPSSSGCLDGSCSCIILPHLDQYKAFWYCGDCFGGGWTDCWGDPCGFVPHICPWCRGENTICAFTVQCE